MPNLFQRKVLAGRAAAALWPIPVSAMTLVLFCSLTVIHATGQSTQAGDPAAWRAIWDQMMPVFTHPRCINCHGGTNPFTGVNHNNGLAVDDNGRASSCTECHSAHWLADGSLSWRNGVTNYGTFGRAPSFVKGGAATPPVPEEAAKICKTILDRMKERDAGPGAVVDHVQKDPLIGLAFAGRRANAIPDTEAADPPPMQHSAFVNLVQDWVTTAAASCDLNGTITITETLTGSRTLTQPAPQGSATITQEESGTRTVNVDVQHGKATMKVEGSGKEQTTQRMDIAGCVTTSTTDSTATSSGSGDGALRLQIAPGGRSLTIILTGPEETGLQQLGAGQMQSCMAGLNTSIPPQQESPIEGTYPYGIEVPLSPPPKGLITELVGTTTQTFKWSMSPPSGGMFPWLLSRLTLGPEGGAQGVPPTVTMKIDWNLKLY